MSFSHWTFIIEIATRYVGWFSWINLPPKSFNSKGRTRIQVFVLGTGV